MVGINPGQLRHKIAFYSIERISDGSGGHTSTEVLKFETLADVKAMKSSSAIESGKMVLIQPYQVSIRYSTVHTLTKDMIVRYKGGKYLIQGIEPMDEVNRMVKLVIVRE